MSLAELQALNYILEHKDFSFVKRNRLTVDHFPTYQDEFRFIERHVKEFGQVPDVMTMVEEFPDFEVIKVGESPSYLANKLREERLYSLVVPTLKQAVEMTDGDATKVVKYLEEQTKRLVQEMLPAGVARDLTEKVTERLEEALRRAEVRGLLGIPSGIKPLDDITNGWLPGDVVVVSGYLGQGKSWLALYFLMQAWKAGYKVCLVSLEMDDLQVGFRFDTLLTGSIYTDPDWDKSPRFSPVTNSGLMSGRLGEAGFQNYANYAQWLRDQGGFLILTSADFPNGCTTDDVDAIIEQYDPDLLCVDQLSLMAFKGKPKSIREGYISIMREIKQIAMRRKKVIMILAQANREAARSKNSTPEIYQMGESNAVGEDADRVLTLTKGEGTMKIALKKNRHGRGGTDAEEWMLRWKIDEGYIALATGGGPEAF